MPLLVNGETIDDSLIRAEAESLRPQYEEAMGEMDPVEREIQLREWSRENVIERVLLRQEAFRDPSPLPAEEVEAALAEAMHSPPGQAGCQRLDVELLRTGVEARLRVERLIEKITARVPAPKSKEAGEYYRKHRDRFWTPEAVHAAHIVKHVNESTTEEQARQAIEAAAAELRAGARFEDVADRYSDCPGNGGDLGWFPRGEMVEEFDQVVFGMQPGETSGIFRTCFGFHIARLIERRPPGLREFSEVRAEIEALLLREKKQKALEDFLDRLRAKADIRKTADPLIGTS